MNNLSNVYYYQAKYAEAEHYVRRALEINRRFLGEDHPQIITNTHNLATMLVQQGKFDQAIVLHEQNLERRRRVQGEDHPRLANTLDRLAEAYTHKDNLDKAEVLYRQALDLRQRRLGEHPAVANSLHNLARLLEARGIHGQAAPLHERAVDLARELLPPENPDRARYVLGLGRYKLSAGEPEAAEPLLREILEVHYRTREGGDPRLAEAADLLDQCLRLLGRNEEAAELRTSIPDRTPQESSSS